MTYFSLIPPASSPTPNLQSTTHISTPHPRRAHKLQPYTQELPQAGTELRREGCFPCSGFMGQGFASQRQERRIGQVFFTELIGTTVLVLMYYNAGI